VLASPGNGWATGVVTGAVVEARVVAVEGHDHGVLERRRVLDLGDVDERTVRAAA
jgi:hypothetical protein